MVDATDLKSVDCKVVWVQVPLPPLMFAVAQSTKNSASMNALFFVSFEVGLRCNYFNVFSSCVGRNALNAS